LLRDDKVLQTEAHETSEEYSIWLLPAVERVLHSAGVDLRDLEAYAVTAGPGSFTGVRAGLTTVKAWAEVYGHGIVVVSRLEAIATQALGTEPYIAAFSDARRNQLFGALYRRTGAVLERVGDEMVIAPASLVAWVADQVASDPIQWISAEPNCLTETDAWAARRTLGETIQSAPSLLAPVVGQLGYARAMGKRLTDALNVDANYVRRTDAELLSKLGAKGDAAR
jgi:tRNA threonylcarbamoyladenosine biosynthesis protein TsaB